MRFTKSAILIALTLLLTFPASIVSVNAQEGFRGTFRLAPVKGSELKRLRYDFGYIDPKGVGWEAPANMATDGASIPLIAQFLVGTPFDPQYLKSAVIHDRYCYHRVRSWEDTHRVFYHALIAEGVPAAKANLMYSAVYLFGPRWQITLKGSPCKVAGKNCVRSSANVSAHVTAEREAKYDTADASLILKRLEAAIESGTVKSDLASLEAYLKAQQPDDWYQKNPSVIDERHIKE